MQRQKQGDGAILKDIEETMLFRFYICVTYRYHVPHVSLIYLKKANQRTLFGDTIMLSRAVYQKVPHMYRMAQHGLWAHLCIYIYLYIYILI